MKSSLEDYKEYATSIPQYMVELLSKLYPYVVDNDPEWGVHLWSNSCVYAVADTFKLAAKYGVRFESRLIDWAINDSRNDDGWSPLPDEWYNKLRSRIEA